ncbi:undecaprenyl-diphosphate phosphatase [Methanopyrus sp.]
MPGLWTSILAGVVQGTLEWLPVSSEGQAAMALMRVIGVHPRIALDLALWLHAGTLLAVLARFARPYLNALVGLVRGGEWRRLAVFLIVATLATGAVGIPIYKVLKRAVSAATGDTVQMLIGLALIVTGLLLRVSPAGLRTRWDVRLSDALLVGLGQGFAVIPGISRSGTTMAILLWRRFDSGDAVWLSFFLAGPAMLGATVLELKEGMEAARAVGTEWMAGALATSFIVSLLSMEVLLRVARRLDFSKVCLLLGAIALLAPLIGKVA